MPGNIWSFSKNDLSKCILSRTPKYNKIALNIYKKRAIDLAN